MAEISQCPGGVVSSSIVSAHTLPVLLFFFVIVWRQDISLNLTTADSLARCGGPNVSKHPLLCWKQQVVRLHWPFYTSSRFIYMP